MPTIARIVKTLPSIRPMLMFCSLEYWKPDAWMSFLALFPRYHAMGAKIVMKIPSIPKIKISVPWGCSGGGVPYGWPYGSCDCWP